MNKFRLFYTIAAAVICFLMFSFWGVTGEGGIATYYLTVALTFPLGLFFGYLLGILSSLFSPDIAGLLSLVFAAVINYFQWVFFISLYKKWKGKRTNL